MAPRLLAVLLFLLPILGPVVSADDVPLLKPVVSPGAAPLPPGTCLAVRLNGLEGPLGSACPEDADAITVEGAVRAGEATVQFFFHKRMVLHYAASTQT